MTKTDIETITHLDFAYTPPCTHELHDTQYYGHEGDAWVLVERLVCLGHKPRYLYLCKGSWEYAQMTGFVHCNLCRPQGWPVSTAWRFITLISQT